MWKHTGLVDLLRETSRRLTDGQGLDGALQDSLEAALRELRAGGLSSSEQQSVVAELDPFVRAVDKHLGRPDTDPALAARLVAIRRLAAEVLTAQRLGLQLRRLRAERGLSIRELAAASGISRSSLQRLEAGSGAFPEPPELDRLAWALKVDREELLGLTRHVDATLEQAVERADMMSELEKQVMRLTLSELRLLRVAVGALAELREQGFAVVGPLDTNASAGVDQLVEALARDDEGIRNRRLVLLRWLAGLDAAGLEQLARWAAQQTPGKPQTRA